MTTENGFDKKKKKEFQRKMIEQFEKQFSEIGHDKDNQKHDKHQKPSE